MMCIRNIHPKTKREQGDTLLSMEEDPGTLQSSRTLQTPLM